MSVITKIRYEIVDQHFKYTEETGELIWKTNGSNNPYRKDQQVIPSSADKRYIRFLAVQVPIIHIIWCLVSKKDVVIKTTRLKFKDNNKLNFKLENIIEKTSNDNIPLNYYLIKINYYQILYWNGYRFIEELENAKYFRTSGEATRVFGIGMKTDKIFVLKRK